VSPPADNLTPGSGAIGFVSPPDWFDPSPDEFRQICGQKIPVQQTILDLPDFDWRMESIARTEPQQIDAAIKLAKAGCSAVAIVGTPFGWAGFADVDGARQRQRRIERASGAHCILAGVAIVDALRAAGVERVALACTYYSDTWRDRFSDYVRRSGFDVVAAQTLSDQGLMPPHEADSRDYWAPTPDQISASVERLGRECPHAEAFVITGAGARTHTLTAPLRAATGRFVIGSDTALYAAILKRFGC